MESFFAHLSERWAGRTNPFPVSFNVSLQRLILDKSEGLFTEHVVLVVCGSGGSLAACWRGERINLCKDQMRSEL